MDFHSGHKSARIAAAILVAKQVGFVAPTAKQRQNLLVAFAKRGKVIYGKAFDLVKLSDSVDLNDLSDIEAQLDKIRIFEIKSTNKIRRPDFLGYFFALTTAELLVAQSLKRQFGFVFVNINTKEHLELTLSQIFARAKAIYPTWSISF